MRLTETEVVEGHRQGMVMDVFRCSALFMTETSTRA